MDVTTRSGRRNSAVGSINMTAVKDGRVVLDFARFAKAREIAYLRASLMRA